MQPGLCDAPGVFPASWISGGPACATEPEIQVHRYDDDTFILRQSLCTSFEAPFLYLMFGDDSVVLEDTGDGGIPLVSTVDSIIDQVLAERGQASIELIVVSSHAHGDHVRGNAAVAARANTTVVGAGLTAVTSYFGITSWPTETAELDLGGRVIDVLPIPGHENSHIALYDRNTGLLLTGDTVYPGRLYIGDFADYQASIDRLEAFSVDNPVCAVLGTHIEMTSSPGQDFAFGATHHPNEHELQLPVGVLTELAAGLAGMMEDPQQEAHDDFIIFPLN